MAQKTIFIWLGTFIQGRSWCNPEREEKKGGEVAYKTGYTLFNVDVSKGRAIRSLYTPFPPLTQNRCPFPRFCFWGRGWLYTGYHLAAHTSLLTEPEGVIQDGSPHITGC